MKTSIDYQKEGQRPAFDQLVLLSQSPRRRELLQFLEPEVASVAIDERAVEEEYMAAFAQEDFLTRAAKTCCEISKAKSDFALEKGKLYLSADTIVVMGETVYNKPQDLAEARAMLQSYFGQSHHVVTSVCLRAQDYLEVFYTVARIDFVPYYPALEPVLEAYLQEGKLLDKAGAYGIQDLDPRFVAGICGDRHTIIGLPVAEVSRRLFGE